MGNRETKIVDPKANVINEVIVEQKNNNGIDQIKLYLLIITVILGIELVLKLYKMHNKRIKKRYIGQINEVERI